MKTFKIISTVIMLMVTAAYSEWKFVQNFPNNNFKGGLGCQGLTVDPDGKVWIQLYNPTDSIVVSPGVKRPIRVIYVFDPNGMPAPFSPIRTINIGGKIDTLFNSSRGLRADHEGNILVSTFDTMYRLDYKTGAGMNKVIPQSGATLTAPAVDAQGDVFTAHVIPSNPIRIFDKDFNFIGNAIDTSKGFSRTFTVSSDGNTIYWLGFTNHAVYRYTRPNEFEPFRTVPDTILKGFDAESCEWHPKTGYLWLSAGSFLNPPNQFPGVKTFWSPNVWYAYNLATDEVVDSLKWKFNVPNNLDERPRAISFTPGGDTAYVACFGTSDYPPVQMFVKTTPPIATIKPEVSTPQLIGAEFWVDLSVGSVQNLFGVSFELNYTNTFYVDVVTPTSSNVIPGPFLGTDVIFVANVNDPAGKVSIGVSRKAGQGGVSGSGVVARVKFKTLSSTPVGTQVVFSLSNISANDPLGNTISLVPSSAAITLADIIVWPGDTNNDKIVNQADVLPIGLFWNKTGPQRPNASTNWIGQPALPWSPVSSTYADADGDGVISQPDVLPITLNWGKTHSLVALASEMANPLQKPTQPNAPNLRMVITGDTNPGREFWVEIHADKVTNLFGIAYELVCSPHAYVDPQTAEPGSFIGPDIIFFSNLDKAAGKICIGVTRKAGQGGINGSGMIAKIKMRTANNVTTDQVIKLTLPQVTAIDPSGNPIQFNGSEQAIFSPVESERNAQAPETFVLYANSPNPFNPATTISYDLPEPTEITLAIFDALGQLVRTLVDQRQPAGRHSIVWDGRDERGQRVASGVFIYQLRAGRFVQSRKMLLLQ